MKNVLAILSLLAVLLLISGCGADRSEPGISMAHEVEAALASGMPVLLDFGGDGCPTCVQMKPTVYRTITDYQDTLRVVMVDTNVDRQLSAEYRVRAIPTYVFIDPSGREIDRHIGFMEASAFDRKVQEFIQRAHR
ncbi:thioredoxin family protein [Desulfurispirillum indicum]|uniref:Thioredoxin domain-containing protein n=1 Tax=Desulfurispirillum indicum (strain ATCC BAA-1389 / DSM 22839 / S5) TaxID=653733 RepID=E6W4I4_DESIS|nr:thioredoxin family protein [Desulfurispirillum indicum]ADU67057.1 Thioredoxin domain-containing protein [Desulfurispirillum indicum S5]UCZ56288.1 thioredoxin family protein [Desulfurispirillum indicum]